ncbi:MAG: PTS fructose-like transporter subunit EIIC [Holophagales bacterium]|jgi:fructose-specific phosphotransferase system IIC component|nr:PTS fructose-like transporter subunit EIIC [Holophagales bacterium]
MGGHISRARQYLLAGVSYAIPFVACGGILIAAAIALVPMTATGPDFSNAPLLKTLLDIGSASFGLLVPVLAGYIAFGMADRPGLAPGFVGGAIAAQVGAGFLGGIVAGLLAGFVVLQVRKLRVPSFLRPVMPILVIPVIGSVVVGFLMYRVVGVPIQQLMASLTAWLREMSTGSSVVLALVLGAMIAFDMGGPVNKVAFFFGAAMIKEGNFAVMGACAAAICVPPLGLGLATLLGRKLWSDEDRDAGWAALAMGMIGITEGAIPFAASDPARVIPTIMLGSAVAAVVATLGGVGGHAPHGGPIVLPVVDHRLAYVVAIVAGSLTVALVINALKKLGTARRGREAA